MSSFNIRKPIFEQIASLRESIIISYVTGDRRHMETQISKEIIDIFVEHLDEIGPTEKISLILYTSGGDTAAAWQLVNLIHTFCETLEVIIPSKALSAGTLISLGADSIIMTKQAALGPIDPSINHPLNPIVPNTQNRAPVSVEAVTGYLDAAKNRGIEKGEDLTQLFIDLSNKVHPLVLGEIFRSRTQIRFLAKKLLKRQVTDDEKVNNIIDFLCAESGSHDYTINRREANDLGLNVEKPSKELYDLLRKLHLSYTEELKLNEPYDPYGLLGTESSFDYKVKRAVIESCKAGCNYFVSEGNLIKEMISVPTTTGMMMQQETVRDNRKFDGWRKEQ